VGLDCGKCPPAGRLRLGLKIRIRARRVAIVRARWNDEITRGRSPRGPVQAALAASAKVEEFEVAGSFELPPAVAMLARSGRFDAVVPLGCLIRGETAHFDVLAHAVARSLAELATSVPVAIPFGVLTCETLDQARARSSPEHNVGSEAMEAALELVSLRHAMASSAARAPRSASTGAISINSNEAETFARQPLSHKTEIGPRSPSR